ncbi:S8 family peptidase [Shewanella sp. SR43-8]|uniref:S8 family peptidase n=1 Tax=Shewanella sp. SR43-8 TaxID=2760938 RepID=UPI0016044C5F|nr:S8 family peptidase [Shewanella sp. SR43-8]MBB1320575.1 S8 family peptidase [Shewanella sp. SR43-8]
MANNRNPIKHVKFSDIDYYKPVVIGRSDNTPLKEVTDEFRSELLGSIESLKNVEGFADSVTVAVVEIEANAIAKSHRPTDIFNERTCPFFGDIGYSKLLIQITPAGLSKLSARISKSKAKTTIKALSTIKSIEKYQLNLDVREDVDSLSVRLFRYNSALLNKKLDTDFEYFLDSKGCEWKKHSSNAVRLYKVSNTSNSILKLLPTFAGIQSVMSSKCIQLKPMVKAAVGLNPPNFLPPIQDVTYPVVAVVDSGVSANFIPLSHWVVGRESCIAPNYKIDEHGTFVSGLISNSFNLNGYDPRFPNCQSKIFSVEVLGSDGGDLYSIIQTMHNVAKVHPEIKVWNLSLGGNSPVSKSEISTMAIMLDEFQDIYSCLCVVAAGNYVQTNRAWPPIGCLDDGISTPGDSVRALTVGSVAHIDGFVKNTEPSSFSRKGPVSNYVQKPEVVHFGGNVLINGGQSIVLGVNSIDVDGNSHHDIGTSFSTPIVSSIAANLFSKIGDRATPSLIKALLIHSANLNQEIADEHKSYYGWGKPQGSEDILSVKDYESTMVFEGKAQKSFEIRKLPFPIPECLRTPEGKVRAEFFITLVYQPELDPQKAFEYCQMDVKVGFGKVIGEKFTSQVPVQNELYLFESDLVKNGDKWSPVKVYKNRFPKGADIKDWKLRVSVMDRDGYEAEGVLIPFSIILTIRDIDKQQPVYNEMAMLMDQYNWEVSNLEVDNQLQV